jgi:hypothetical protein
MITDGKSEIVLGTCDLRSAETRTNIDNDYTCLAGGNATMISGKTTTVASKTDSVKIKAPLGSVDTKASLGVSSDSLTYSVTAVATATMTSMLSEVKGYAITTISGGIIMIG